MADAPDMAEAERRILEDRRASVEADLDRWMQRQYTLYDIGKALPHPYDALGDEANRMLHDFVGLASRVKSLALAYERALDRQAQERTSCNADRAGGAQ